MKKHSLSTKGLSLSQAQSISNLCNQASRNIEAKISMINNSARSLTVDTKVYIETPGHPMPVNIIDMLNEKARLHAAQAFLMENIKTKEELLFEIRNRTFKWDKPEPDYPKFHSVDEDREDLIELGEDWGWSQLSNAEYNEYLEAEAFASHIGQFIHRAGKLDRLRTELPSIKTLEWFEVETGKKTPLNVDVHHTIDQLAEIHDQLAALHRQHEQRVNYYRAKVKNLVTAEQARRARALADLMSQQEELNSKLRNDYRVTFDAWNAERSKASMEFEEARQKEISETAALRIVVDFRFKVVIDNFMKQLEDQQD
jgi:hypothetical protein